MNRLHMATKSLWQIVLVLIEVIGVTSLLVYLSHTLKPLADSYDLLERAVTFVAIYEVVVYITLSFVIDARRDALLALRTAHEQAVYYIETGLERARDLLVEKIEKQMDVGVFNQLDVRRAYQLLRDQVEERDIDAIKYSLIGINHEYEMCNLQWRFTFFLRLFK